MTPGETEAACTTIAVNLRSCAERLSGGQHAPDVEALAREVVAVDAALAELPVAHDLPAEVAERCALLLRQAQADRHLCVLHLERLRTDISAAEADVLRSDKATRAYRQQADHPPSEDARFVDRQQ